ncbi:galactose-specific lectin nattectin-like [Megalobrama amblycephala]|uniref:galactose-specific lectin nattectin-like n=1 Tax=Megalobrama amblycephala TaxID=75352 RepID=UPI0020147C86|nr:galactose-specific lectin nattectin-like [Megalobrama amblycephala]XP_048015905.1 galactose-specific lectin nattectin-like [Megalobrama amblycephala]
MAVWTVYLSIFLLVTLNASVETRPFEKNKDCGTCETGWTAFGCRCFKFYNELRTWSSAEFGCLYYGGNLASAHSHDEYIFIQNLIRRTTHASTPAWIGLHHVDESSYWFWSDGTKMIYKIWSPGQPSNGKDENCVEMNSVNGNWNDLACSYKKPYVCVK